MSKIKYGLISRTDAACLERTIDLICNENHGELNICEIGIFDGQTARGIYEHVTKKQYGSIGSAKGSLAKVLNYKCNYTAIDNNKDKEVLRPFPECNLIIGNSNEVYNQLEDNSQHLIFVDGCHCFAHVISDFFCYADKVKVGGYMAFHDTGKHIKPFKDFQHGDKDNPDAFISVRKALTKIELFKMQKGYFIDAEKLEKVDFEATQKKIDELKELGNQIGILPMEHDKKQWQLIYDVADETNEAGGITVFKKLY